MASDCNGNREQIEDGADGLLCALMPEAVADSIASLLEDEEKRIALGQAAGRRDFAQGQELETFLALLD